MGPHEFFCSTAASLTNIMYDLEVIIVHPLTLYLELSSTVSVLHLYRIQYLLFLHSAGPLAPELPPV